MSQDKFTVFFSWQSDVKGNTKVIRDSLKAECQKQNEKNGYKIEIDEATRNMPGSPKIEDAILEKIANADIFVCDITPIVVSNDGKQMPNSNVIFELGYALHTLGDRRIVMLAKKGSWDIKDMPFDFNHRRIGVFSSAKDCDLSFEIDSCIKECVKNPIRKFKWKSFVNSLLPKGLSNSNDNKAETIRVGDRKMPLLKATEESTVFFARRMASAFPGVRGLKEITNSKVIRKCLKVLLQDPLHFSHGLENCTSVPVWWFRGGSCMDISSFSLLWPKKVLLDGDEFVIKRILVYRNPATYYNQYVYVETLPDKPCGCYKYSPEHIKEIAKDFGYFDEEYADLKPARFLPVIHIKRQDYDDNSTIFLGRHIELGDRAKLRTRYLTSYNFIICAQDAPYNSDEFSSSSQQMFNGMLEGKVSDKDFHQYMMNFPKRRRY